MDTIVFNWISSEDISAGYAAQTYAQKLSEYVKRNKFNVVKEFTASDEGLALKTALLDLQVFYQRTVASLTDYFPIKLRHGARAKWKKTLPIASPIKRWNSIHFTIRVFKNLLDPIL